MLTSATISFRFASAHRLNPLASRTHESLTDEVPLRPAASIIEAAVHLRRSFEGEICNYYSILDKARKKVT